MRFTPTCPKCSQPMVIFNRNLEGYVFWVCQSAPICNTTARTDRER